MSDATSNRSRDDGAPVEPHRPTARSLLDVAGAFLRLGCLSFGGPIAHLGYLRAEFVEKRKWLDDAHYGDLVALCQFLPGPASRQVVFALGMQRVCDEEHGQKCPLFPGATQRLCWSFPDPADFRRHARRKARSRDRGA
jgi:hypothetical protein